MKLDAILLQLVALCHHLFDENTPKRAMHALFKPGDVSTFLEKLEKLEGQIEIDVKNCERARSQEADTESRRLLMILKGPNLRTDDECQPRNRVELVNVFDYLLTEASKPLTIFISSRPDLDIKRKLRDRTDIEIDAQGNQDDISRFVQSRISKHPEWDTITRQLQDDIVTTLLDKSRGM